MTALPSAATSAIGYGSFQGSGIVHHSPEKLPPATWPEHSSRWPTRIPAESRSQSSRPQPCSWMSGPRKSAASATRPVMTTSAPSASAAAIGNAPRYADANNGDAGKAENGSPVSMLAKPEVVFSTNGSSLVMRSSPSTVATRKPEMPICLAVALAARAAAAGLMPPAFVITFVRPSITAGNDAAR